MGEAKRRRVAELEHRPATALAVVVKCAGGGDPALCCTPGAWERVHAMGTMALYLYGEPLPQAVIDVAAERGIEPHALDHHVEGVHGWEPHDTGYAQAVRDAAACLLLGGCET